MSSTLMTTAGDQSLLSPGAMTLRFGSVEDRRAPFLIVAMYTASYAATAERLLGSLRKSGLPHAMYEVPAVHRSISPKGCDDLAFTKPSFITRLLNDTQRPVLYVDADTMVRRNPVLLATLLRKGCDLAIFNWLAVDTNDAYLPVGNEPPEPGKPDSRLFYRYSHAIDYIADDQLICSGAVQLWAPTAAARTLLAQWQETIAAQPGVPDDQCLDFAFNNRTGAATDVQPNWLPRSYARYAWWIFDEPFIDHPDFPYSGADLPKISDPAGRQRFYGDRAKIRSGSGPIPRDCILDTATGNLYRLRDNQLVPAGRLIKRTWLPNRSKT